MAKSKSKSLLNNSGNNMFSVLNTDEYDDNEDYVEVEKETPTPTIKTTKKKTKSTPTTSSPKLKEDNSNKKTKPTTTTTTSSPVVSTKTDINKKDKSIDIDKKKLNEIENKRIVEPSPSMFNQVVTIFISVLLTVITYASDKLIGEVVSKVGSIILLLFTLYLTKELVMPVTKDLNKFKKKYVINQIQELRDEKKRLKNQAQSSSNDKKINLLKEKIEKLELEFEKLDSNCNDNSTDNVVKQTNIKNKNKNKIKTK